jgi:hypothetical protein
MISATPTPPIVSYPWSYDGCSGFVLATSPGGTVDLVCRHGPAWGKPVYGCSPGSGLTVLLSGRLVCIREATVRR